MQMESRWNRVYSPSHLIPPHTRASSGEARSSHAPSAPRSSRVPRQVPDNLDAIGHHLIVLHHQLSIVGLLRGDKYALAEALRALNLAKHAEHNAKQAAHAAGSDAQRWQKAREHVLREISHVILPSAMLDRTFSLELETAPKMQLMRLASQEQTHIRRMASMTRRLSTSRNTRNTRRTSQERHDSLDEQTSELGVRFASAQLASAQVLLARTFLVAHQASLMIPHVGEAAGRLVQSRVLMRQAGRWVKHADALNAQLSNQPWLKTFRHEVLAHTAMCRPERADMRVAVSQLEAALNEIKEAQRTTQIRLFQPDQRGDDQHLSTTVASASLARPVVNAERILQKEAQVCETLGFALYMAVTPQGVRQGFQLFSDLWKRLGDTEHDESLKDSILLGKHLGSLILGEESLLETLGHDLERLAQETASLVSMQTTIHALASAMLAWCHYRDREEAGPTWYVCVIDWSTTALKLLEHEMKQVGPAGLRMEYCFWAWSFAIECLFRACDERLVDEMRTAPAAPEDAQALSQEPVGPETSFYEESVDNGEHRRSLEPDYFDSQVTSEPSLALQASYHEHEFTFLRAERLRAFDGRSLPPMQDLEALPDAESWLVTTTLNWSEVCEGKHATDVLVVSQCAVWGSNPMPAAAAAAAPWVRPCLCTRALSLTGTRSSAGMGSRWMNAKEPDGDGTQLRAIQHFLKTPENKRFHYVWYDYACCPQRRFDVASGNARDRTADEEAVFRKTLESVNMLYLGCHVLILMDASCNQRWPKPKRRRSARACPCCLLAPASSAHRLPTVRHSRRGQTGAASGHS